MTGKPPDPARRPAPGVRRQELIRQRQAADRQIVEELAGTTGAAALQYVWGQYIDEMIQLKALINVGPQPLAAGNYYLLSDLLYRSAALTNSTGGIVEAFDTDAYGNTLLFSAGGGTGGAWFSNADTQAAYSACRYVFTGREYDPETAMYYYRVRYYQPPFGRFTSRDPLGGDGGANMYAYAAGRPLVEADPSGLVAFALGGGVSLGAAGGLPIAGVGVLGIADISETEYAGHDARGFFWEDCTTASLGLAVGGGGAVAAGSRVLASVQIGKSRPGTGSFPAAGVMGAWTVPPLAPLVLRSSLNVNLNSGMITVGIPAGAAGVSAFIGVTFTGNCRACTPHVCNPFALTRIAANVATRYAGVWKCVQQAATNIANGLKALAGKKVPAQGATFQLPGPSPQGAAG